MDRAERRTGVVLAAMGGPSSPDDVERFLRAVFSDRSIIRLPGGPWAQGPFARMIARRRAPVVRARYELIGGRSPLLDWTLSQAAHVERELAARGVDAPCRVAMRYAEPSFATTVEELAAEGVEHLVVVPMYPQYSAATTGSCEAELDRALAATVGWGAPPRREVVADFHDHPRYVDLLRDDLERHTAPDDVLVFSAHAVPRSLAERGDPYVDQVRRTMALVAGDRPHHLAFQSRTGPVRWVGPDTVDVVRELLASSDRRICIVPIAFVCDHIETLHELDIDLPARVGAPPGRLHRLPMPNDDPRLGAALADLVEERIHRRAHA
ncbi:MAG: ferrochelatase [Actinomycetota bacterium]|nr:ferrochelatase [Actinomycetota bacterium]